jgi:Antirestriction protein (ArdA)
MTSDTTSLEGAARRPLSPRIYVACLAAYNSGRLHGAWIDADQPVEDIYDEIKSASSSAHTPVPRPHYERAWPRRSPSPASAPAAR